MLKHLFRIIALLAIVIVVGLGVATYQGILAPAPGSLEAWQRAFEKELGPAEHTKLNPKLRLHEQTRVFEMAGRTFEIPIMYISGRPKPGVQQDAMLLDVIWPDMLSVYELKDRNEYERIWRDEGRLGQILIEPAVKRPSLNEQTASREKRLARNEFMGVENDLEKRLWFNGTPEEPRLWAELYLNKDENGLILDRIECRAGEVVISVICVHIFVDNKLIYQITYKKDSFFAQWRKQKQRAIDFIKQCESVFN